MDLVTNFRELISEYDTFVFDIWGVVHDGKKPFPGIRGALEELKSAGKEVVFLTNMSQLSAEVEGHLNGMNVPRNLYRCVLSSGQAALEYIQKISTQDQASCFHLNDDVSFRKYLSHLNINFVDDINLADFLLVARGPLLEILTQANSTILSQAAHEGKPLICANPDTAVVIDGEFQSRSGSITQTYVDLGGEVLAFGKPHPTIYEQLKQKLTKHGRILMIGDSLETDIEGARAQGWDALLVLTGVTAHKNGWLYQSPSREELQILDSNNGPTYVFAGFTA